MDAPPGVPSASDGESDLEQPLYDHEAIPGHCHHPLPPFAREPKIPLLACGALGDSNDNIPGV